jgi:hypothetical protein
MVPDLGRCYEALAPTERAVRPDTGFFAVAVCETHALEMKYALVLIVAEHERRRKIVF